MCNLTLSSDMGNESLPEDIAYACVFCIDHICMTAHDIPSVMDHVGLFLDRHILHWFAAMSILRRSRDTISPLHHLYAWIVVSFLLSCTGSLYIYPRQKNSPGQTIFVDLVRDSR
jgi:hypothetical protein